MSLWWLQPGWTETPCARCGQTIYPEGDPDWGLCGPSILTAHFAISPSPSPATPKPPS